MKPVYRILADDQDITVNIQRHFQSLRIRDARGHESDELEIRITDPLGNIAMPRRGVKLQVFIGFEGLPLQDKGSFVVDETRHSGPPDIITIHAKAADMLESLKTGKTRSWHETTLGSIINIIAGEHTLRPAIADQYASLKIPHIDQTEESDLNSMTGKPLV